MNHLKRLGILAVSATFIVAIGARPAAAQKGEVRGEVTALSNSSLTVQTGQQSMTFVIDPATHVEASGASTRTRAAEAAGGSAAIKVSDYVKVGSPVLVSYRETDGRNHALNVRPISSAGGGGAAEDDVKNVQGKVKTITASSITVEQDGRDQAFPIDSDTTVAAKGAGKATKGGGVPVTNLVHVGDIVSLSYRGNGAAMKVSEIRIRGRNTIPAK
jgi:Domain of unknown function (DUF5666)